jgi:hypothetical protein
MVETLDVSIGNEHLGKLTGLSGNAGCAGLASPGLILLDSIQTDTFFLDGCRLL